MLGAIAGDVIGSLYERRPIKTTEFPLFHRLSRPTDDTVLTVAVADSILSGRDLVVCLKEYACKYPDAGYGGLVAAPLFRSVARATITRLGIAPTDPLPLPPHALPVG